MTRQSGSSIRGETRSRRGNRASRNTLFLSAFASRRDPASRAYYDRKRAKARTHAAALLCLARRRTDVLYAMIRTCYQPRPRSRRSATRQQLDTNIGTLMLEEPVDDPQSFEPFPVLGHPRVIRTITERRRCRSIPTTCRPSQSLTGASFNVCRPSRNSLPGASHNSLLARDACSI